MRDSQEMKRQAMVEEAAGKCVWCGRVLWPGEGTIDHVIPKIKGGPSWPENEVLACKGCNNKRGAKMPLAYLVTCQRKGYHPNCVLIEKKLRDLEALLDETPGGHRKLRQKLDHQLRRL